MAIPARILHEVFLVVFFGHVIVSEGRDFRDKLRGMLPLFVRHHLVDQSLIGGIFIVDAAAVLYPPVISLPIQGRRIYHFKEISQQGGEINPLRIILNVDRFGVTGVVVANLFIGRILRIAVGITYVSVNYAVQLVQIRFQPPEAAACQPYFAVILLK